MAHKSGITAATSALFFGPLCITLCAKTWVAVSIFSLTQMKLNSTTLCVRLFTDVAALFTPNNPGHGPDIRSIYWHGRHARCRHTQRTLVYRLMDTSHGRWRHRAPVQCTVMKYLRKADSSQLVCDNNCRRRSSLCSKCTVPRTRPGTNPRTWNCLSALLAFGPWTLFSGFGAPSTLLPCSSASIVYRTTGAHLL